MGTERGPRLCTLAKLAAVLEEETQRDELERREDAWPELEDVLVKLGSRVDEWRAELERRKQERAARRVNNRARRQGPV